MNGTVRLGRFAGVVVRAHWSVLVIAALIAEVLAEGILPSAVEGLPAVAYWAVGIAVCLLFLASLLAHEVSHAVVARRRGLIVKDITLWMLGGATAIEGEASDPSTTLRVALVGPLVSLLCGGVSFGIAMAISALDGSALLTAGFAWLGLTNGIIAVFNLLPGAPLDGGRVLQAVLWRRSGDRYAATLAASRAGRVFGMLLVAAGVMNLALAGDVVGGIWLALIGWFLMQAAAAEAGFATLEHDLSGVAAEDAMETDYATVSSWQSVMTAASDAASTRCDYCAVCGLQGEAEALVPVDAVVAAARSGRDERVRDIAVRFPPMRSCEARADLAVVLGQAGGALPIAVTRDGRPVGIVTQASLRRVMRRRQVPTPTG